MDTIDELIASGADVNIVGADDVMPLTLAHSLDESFFEKQRIVDTLLQRYTMKHSPPCNKPFSFTDNF